MKAGVTSPMRTDNKRSPQRGAQDNRTETSQLFIQFDAVDKATPLLLIDMGKTSLGSTHPMGPNDMPYAAVNVYTHL
jgi:hypothetical protein